MNLTQLKAGEEGVFVDVQGGRGIMQRLEAMGITAGVKIKKVSTQLLHGPVLIQMGSTQMAIGFGMAKKMIVEKIKA